MHAHDYLNPTQLNPTVASDNDRQTIKTSVVHVSGTWGKQLIFIYYFF